MPTVDFSTEADARRRRPPDAFPRPDGPRGGGTAGHGGDARGHRAVAVVPALVPGAGDGDRALTVLTLLPIGVRGLPGRWPSSPPWCRAAAASCCRGTRRRRTRSARPPTTSAPCCWRRSTSRGCSRPGCCSAALPTASGRRGSWWPRRSWSCCGCWSPPSIAQVVAWTMEAVRRRRHGIVVDAGAVRGLLGSRGRGCTLRDQLDPAARPGADRVARGRSGSTASPGAGRSRSAVEVAIALVAATLSGWCRPTSRPGGPPATSYGSRARPARRGPTRARTCSRWSAPTGPRCGGPCRCDAACSCSPIGPGLVARRRRPAVARDDDPARPGRVRRRSAVRRQRVVPRRPRRPVAREPAGRLRRRCSPRGPSCWPSSCWSPRRSRSCWPSLRAGMPSARRVRRARLHAGSWSPSRSSPPRLRWSARRPFAVDLRSARATPAPPVVMVGYSTRLAVSTTLTGLVFSGLARTPRGRCRCWWRCRSWRGPRRGCCAPRQAWTDPVQRSRVVVSVAA